MRVWLTGIVLVLLGATVLPAGAMPRDEIAATGSAVAYAEPDYVTFLLHISSVSKDVSEAAERTAAAKENALSVLRDMGVHEVNTHQYQVSPKWKEGDRRSKKRRKQLVGHQALHVLAVRMENVEAIDEVTCALARAGINGVGSIKFHTTDADSLYELAVEAAAGQARIQAEKMAAAAGYSLGKLIEMSTGTAIGVARRAKCGQTPAVRVVAGTRHTAGARQVRCTVLARWRIVTGKGD
jgi:uncharacterized protein YggE